MNIEWKEISPDYIVSSDGRIGSRKGGALKVMKPHLGSHGYLTLHIRVSGVRLSKLVHRAVADAFLPPRPTPAHEINHKNGIKTDNRDTNLEWVTSSENKKHNFRVLGYRNRGHRGTENGNAKLTEADVRQIRARRQAGESQRRIAQEFGVCQQLVSQVAMRQAWGWLDAQRD